MPTLILPQSCQKLIDSYFVLNISDKKVSTPYYINESYDEAYIKNHPVPSDIFRFKKRKTTNRALIGKGSPSELEKTVYEFADKKRFNLKNASVIKIREFMMDHGIGIECSGFVVWVLNELYKEKYNQPIWKFLQFKTGLLRKFLVGLRPVENISVRVLKENSIIKNIFEVKPGDLIISWNGNHVLLVSKVMCGTNNNPLSFEYVNATWWYGKENGVRKGLVKIQHKKGELKDQIWLQDNDEKKKNWTYEGIKTGSKLMRLKSLL